jgi:2-oxo-4-hydroxy-4-carboxy-5-ureidoimidazoline decarboxylase
MLTVAELNAMDRAAFLAALGHLVEHSPWVMERTFARRPFADRAALHRAMMAAIEATSDEERLALLRAHPDLAGKAARAGAMTAASVREQGSAGLDRLSDEDYARFERLNGAYREKFAFPFLIAVRLETKDSILAAYEARLGNDAGQEMAHALAEIGRITRLRLEDAVAP